MNPILSLRKLFTRQATPDAERRSLADVSVYADAMNSLLSLANTSTVSGENINERTALSISSVFACCRNIGDDVGKTQSVVYRKLIRGKQRLLDHAMHRIMAVTPNPEMTPMNFFRALVGSALLFGNGYAWIERDKYTGEALRAWPIHPWRVRVLRDETGNLYYSIDGCKRREIADMLHIQGFGTSGVLGFMMTRLAKESLGLIMAADKFASSFFGNSALPKGVFVADGVLSDEARERMVKQWNDKFRGAGKGNGTAVLEHGLKWQPMSNTPEEGQMLEVRAFQLLEVARWFRMPPHKLMDLSKGTMQNLEQQNGEYISDCLMSWYIQIEQEFKRKLTRDDEVDVYPEFLASSFLRGDTTARTAMYASGIQWGWMNRNEPREMENLNPVDGLDEFLVPANMTAASALEKMTKSQMLAMQLASKNNPALQIAKDILPPSDDATDDTESQDNNPAKGVELGDPTIPPPEGVVLPGSQPIDDSFFGRSKKIGDAQRPVLVDALRRVLRNETDKVTRALKGKDFAAWMTDFYPKHADYVRSAIRPALVALCDTVWAINGIIPSTEQRFDLDAQITAMANKYIEESKADLSDVSGIEQRVAHWVDARPEQFAQVQIDELLQQVFPGVKS